VTPDDFSRRDIEFHRQTAKSYDDDVTKTYAVYHRYLLEPFLDRLAERVGRGRALDLGCGTGVISLALAVRGFDVVGVDHSEDMLAIAEKKLAEGHVAGARRFIVGDVRELPLADAQFDCVTCQGVLHHLPEMEACLSEIRRVLRPGGFFYISEPSSDETPLKVALRRLWSVRRLGRRPPEPEGPESVEEPIAASELRALLDRLGLRYEIEFLTHLRPLRGALPENLYLLAVRAASFPWRGRKGDLIFVFGQKSQPSDESGAVG
jgi:demethylmenaquinone methyltransferase/2-methoxy-6-polyprenyl-1,4-benzoquinol methylase